MVQKQHGTLLVVGNHSRELPDLGQQLFARVLVYGNHIGVTDVGVQFTAQELATGCLLVIDESDEAVVLLFVDLGLVESARS